MRAELGILGLTVGLWLAGAGIALAAGVVSLSARSVLTWTGACYLVGLSAIGVVLTGLSYAGVRVTTPLTAVAILGFAGAGAAVWLLRRPASLAVREGVPRDRGFLIAGAAVAALFLFAGTALALVRPIYEWDGWAIWGVKSLLLYDHGSVPDGFATGDYVLTHVDYPLLWPVLEAAHYRAMGGVEPKLAALPHWIAYVAFGWTVAAVGARLTRPAIWIPMALGALPSVAILQQVFTHYADVPTAMLAGAAALFAGMWLAGDGARWLVLAVPLLAATANGKNEGVMAVAALLGGLAVALLFRSGPRLRPLAALVPVAIVVVLSILPWRLWMATFDVEADIKASRALDPGYLSDESERVGPAARRLWEQITGTTEWGLLAFVALALMVFAVARRTTRALGTFYAVTTGLLFLFLLLAYWVAGTDLAWHLDTSANRVVQLLAFVGIAAALQLGAALYEDDRR